jgi:acetyltransferase
MAFVAIAETGTPSAAPSGALLGVARLVADPDYTKGEYAILLRSDLKGRGLGWRLMQHLIAYARSEGLAEVQGSVLAENTTMLRMCRELGFTVEAEPADPSTRSVALSLGSRCQAPGLGR